MSRNSWGSSRTPSGSIKFMIFHRRTAPVFPCFESLSLDEHKQFKLNLCLPRGDIHHGPRPSRCRLDGESIGYLNPSAFTARNCTSVIQSFRLVRERRRIAWILLLLAVLFALCWLPYNVLMLLKDLGAVGEWSFIDESPPIVTHLLIEFPCTIESWSKCIITKHTHS